MRDADEVKAGAANSQRDRRIVRRAFVAGGVVWSVLTVGFVTLAALSGQGPRTWTALGLLALLLGVMSATAWLLLAAMLDLVAGMRPSRRRLTWTAAMLLATIAMPILVLAAYSVG